MAGFCEHSDEPSGSIKKVGYFMISWVTISFSNNILHHGVSVSEWDVRWMELAQDRVQG
jgi:hypothetical protein